MIYTYNLTGEIKTGESEKFNNFLNDVNERGEGEIRVVINSQGGSVTEGLALYDAISACKNPTKAEIIGVCASAATYIACGADSCEMSKNSTYMTHEPTAGLFGSVAEIKKDLEYFDTLRSRVIAVYGAKTGLSADKAEEIFIRNTNYMDAQTALDFGLVDHVDGLERTPYVEETEEPAEEPTEEVVESPSIVNRLLTFTGLQHKLDENNAAMLKVQAENTYKEQIEELENKVKELQAENVANKAELEGYKETLQNKAELLKKKEEEFDNSVAREVANRLSSLAVNVEELPAPSTVNNNINISEIVKAHGLEQALAYLTK